MKKMIIEWKKPVIRSTTFEEITKYIKAMARSNDGSACISCNVECATCTACNSGCSCAMDCNPSALYLSCSALFLIGRSGNAGTGQ